jgi:hypothetical protein
MDIIPSGFFPNNFAPKEKYPIATKRQLSPPQIKIKPQGRNQKPTMVKKILNNPNLITILSINPP